MSGSLFQTYSTNADAVENGAWNTDYEADIRVKVRSARSVIVTRTQEKIDERNSKYLRRGKPVPRDVQRKNQIDMCVAVVADWTKQSDPAKLPDGENGQPMQCTEENVRQAAQLDEFREQTIGFAHIYTNYREAELEELAGNSARSGAPSSAPAVVSETPEN